MENHEYSQIRTLSYVENEDHPVFGTLVEQILHLLNSRLVFSDIIIHQNSPLLLRQPKGLVAVSDSPITKEELEEYKERDPIEHVLKVLKTTHKMSDADIAVIDDRVKAQVEESVKFAEESPWPSDDELLKDVYVQADYPFIVD